MTKGYAVICYEDACTIILVCLADDQECPNDPSDCLDKYYKINSTIICYSHSSAPEIFSLKVMNEYIIIFHVVSTGIVMICLSVILMLILLPCILVSRCSRTKGSKAGYKGIRTNA